MMRALLTALALITPVAVLAVSQSATIWPTSQRVGCATASNRSHDYLVCRYLPAGNIIGTILR